MGACTNDELGVVAVPTQNLEPILGEAMLAQPSVETASTTSLLTVCIAIVVNVINRQVGFVRLTAADALGAIRSENVLSKRSAPLLDIASFRLDCRFTLMRADAARKLGIVAIEAEELIPVLRIAFAPECQVEAIAKAVYASMCSTIVVDMIQ
jgi:hypothetical protein